MPHSIFGWSYPPGCSGPPDQPEMPCAICGKQVDAKVDPCTCPPCTHKDEDGEECGECGCIKHVPLRDLLSRLEMLQYQVSAFEAEVKRRQEEMTYPCPGCRDRITPNLRSEDGDYCPKCRKEIYRDKDGIGRFVEQY